MYAFYYDAESQAPAAAPKHEEEDEDEDEDELYQEASRYTPIKALLRLYKGCIEGLSRE
jgi:hypothetical protein